MSLIAEDFIVCTHTLADGLVTPINKSTKKRGLSQSDSRSRLCNRVAHACGLFSHSLLAELDVCETFLRDLEHPRL